MIRFTCRYHADTELLRFLDRQFHAVFTDHLAQTVVPADQSDRLQEYSSVLIELDETEVFGLLEIPGGACGIIRKYCVYQS